MAMSFIQRLSMRTPLASASAQHPARAIARGAGALRFRTSFHGVGCSALQHRPRALAYPVSVPSAGLRAVASAAAEEKGEKKEFQAEVSRLLDLIVNSIYSNKEVFLRELVSNASDALDKMRFKTLTDESLQGAESEKELAIKIKGFPEQQSLVIEDSGIGMTREEMVDSLGTIARSGTSKFMEALKEAGQASDSNLIGQFGVGFYSAFLAADRVTVRSKSPYDDKQHVWESSLADSSYSIYEDTEGERLERGTQITLHLKEDSLEFADPEKLSALVKQYSEFISFPIYLWQSEQVPREELDEEATAKAKKEWEDKKTAGEEGVPEEEPAPTMKTTYDTVWDWRTQNENKPIWLKSPREVEEAEYNDFFKGAFREFLDPLAYSHFSTEGSIEFKSLLFVPGMAPFDQQDMMAKSRSIRLFVKRVFISDEFDENLLPRYLHFIKGIVDSSDLPLNVSREILQESRVVRIMKKRLVSKALDMIGSIAKREETGEADYERFWSAFGQNLKLGLIEDQENRDKLAKLCRFYSSKSGDKLISLSDYVANMPESQSSIYFLAAESKELAGKAPFVENLIKRGYEVLYLLEPVDEVAITNLQKFDEKTFVDVSKEEIELEETEEEKKEQEKKDVEFQDLCTWIKSALGDNVQKVVVSKRLSSSPCIVVTSKFGWSANMERIMKAQAVGDDRASEYMKGRKILEINPEHAVIKAMQSGFTDPTKQATLTSQALLMFETACMTSGFQPKDPTEFADRVYSLLSSAAAASPATSPATESAAKEEAPAASAAAESVEPEILPEGGEKNKDGAWKDYY